VKLNFQSAFSDKKISVFFIAAALLLAVPAQGQSGLSFANPVVYGSDGTGGSSVAVADLNGDGKPDLVITNSCANGVQCATPSSANSYDGVPSTLVILLGNGDGSFQAPISYATGGQYALAVVVADVNGDGKPDLLVLNGCPLPSASQPTPCSVNTPSLGSVGVLLGNGDGTFQPAASYSSGGNSTSLAVADVNGDGKPDVLVGIECGTACSSGGLIAVMLGNGDGSFQGPVSYGSGGYPAPEIAVKDVNGDGKPDLVVANACPAEEFCSPYLFMTPSCPFGEICTANNGVVGVLLGNGDGTFQAAVTYGSAGDAQSVAVADVNGDGKPDIVIYNYCGPGNTCPYGLPNNGQGTLSSPPTTVSTVAVLLGNGDGTFQTAVTYPAGGYGQGMAVIADVNGDGKPDIVVSNESAVLWNGNSLSPGNVGVLLGNGDGTFQSVVNYESGGYYAGSLAVADMSGDSKPDLIVSNLSGTNSTTSADAAAVGVLLNTTGVAGPMLEIFPGGLTLSSSAVGIASTPQTITLTDTGSTAISITNIGLTGVGAAAFAQSNTCATTLAAGATCQINVTYTQAQAGSQTAAVSITDNASGSPQMVTLTGTIAAAPPPPPPASAPAVSFSPSTVTFSGQYVGTSGLPRTVTITNTGTAPLIITNVATTAADFGLLSNCNIPMSSGISCTIGVFFDPTTGGMRTGTLTITDNAGNSPQTVALTGSGSDYSMTPGAAASATVTAGQTASYTIAVAPAGGFAASVALSCSGGPAQSTCTVSPNSIALSGKSAATAMVTVTTMASAQGPVSPRVTGRPMQYRQTPLILALSWVLLLMAAVLSLLQREQRFRWAPTFALALLVCLGMTLTSCGGGSGGTGGTNPQAGTYTVTVTGNFTSGATTLNHSAKLTLVVQ
jgi:hypothetical protein